jgi:hypothetical protein
MNKRNNAGPRKFKVPQRKEAYKMKAFIRKNKHNSTTKVFRVKCSGKKALRNPNILFIKKSQQKKTSSSGKGQDAYFFGPNITSKKVWVPRFQQKMYEFQKKVPKKKNSYFLVPNIVPIKVWVPKKV